MSKRIPSVLIGEDARGIALNQTLGLPNIKDYCNNGKYYSNNKYLSLCLKNYLERLQDTDYLLLKPAYHKMKIIYYNDFVPFIRRICNDK